MVKYLVVVTILAKVVQKCKFLQKSFFYYFFEVVFFFPKRFILRLQIGCYIL